MQLRNKKKTLNTNKKVNWDLFRCVLDKTITLSTHLKTGADIKTTIEKFTNNIINAARIATSMVTSRNHRITCPQEIRNLSSLTKASSEKNMV
jgi:hypothetical protein